MKDARDANDESMIRAFKENMEYLGDRCFKPSFNIIDNIASKAIWAYLKKEKVGIQLVDPHNHRVNAVERAIRTFKNHFIAGLCISKTETFQQSYGANWRTKQ